MSSEEDLENQGFKVRDRRRFAPDGTPLGEAEAAEPAFPPPEAPAGGQASSKEEAPRKEGAPSFSQASFTGLILSLMAGAQAALGIAPNPLTGKVEVRLPEAQHSIDLLALLAEKTKGNLSREEEHLLQTILYDLRLRYVEAKESHQ